MKNLQFIPGQSYTVSQFKDKVGVDQLDIKQSLKTGKIFFAFVGGTGAVTKKFTEQGNSLQRPMVSRVIGDSGEMWLLHEQGEGSPTLASL